MTEEKKQSLVITGSGDRSIHDVAEDLRSAGLDVDQVLEFIGTVTGFAPPRLAERLRRIPGVADVSLDHPVNVGPPGAPIS